MNLLWKQLGSLLVPATMTVLVPGAIVLLAGTRPVELGDGLRGLAIALGVVLIATGLTFLAWTVVLFDRIGKGTLAAWPHTRHLVVHGPYRHVRNPMISGVLGIQLGEAVATRSPLLLGWFVFFLVAAMVAIRLVEEPSLARRFGAEYDAYRRAVPAWVPRVRPWVPDTGRHPS